MDKELEQLKNQKVLRLYHGSRGGIEGTIAPISRTRCDFGQGFYMVTTKEQAEMLVADDDKPVIYEVVLDMRHIPSDRIWYVNENEWLYTVLANRKYSQEFNRLTIAKEYYEKAKRYDVIIGLAANDIMKEAIRSFQMQALSIEGVIACLHEANTGYQIVLKSKLACQHINVINHYELSVEHSLQVQEQANTFRLNMYDVISQKTFEYRLGVRLQDIVNAENGGEVN